MIPLPLEEVARLCPGRLDTAPWAEEITGVQIDSRRIDEGDLFVAVGSGADYRKHAFARGAAAVLLPEDAFPAMAALGRVVRERSSARVVAITGSTGKTSTKDVLAALCRPHAATVAAEASFNNELGVPLTLCRLELETEVCVLELAMRGLGQITELCEIARPDVGVITAIGPVHLEVMGSVEAVAQAKAELVAALPPAGTAIVPAGVPELEPLLTRSDLTIHRFGEGGDAQVESLERLNGRARVRFGLESGPVELELNVTARYQVQNALAALLAYEALGLPVDRAQEGAAAIALSRWRGEETALPGGGLLVNDSYNANPASMNAALQHLADRGEGRRLVAVLGDMAELGADGPAYHRAVGEEVARLGVRALLAVGELARGYVDGAGGGVEVARWVPTVEEATAALDEMLRPGDAVLVKGSRAMGLEAIAEALTLARA